MRMSEASRLPKSQDHVLCSNLLSKIEKINFRESESVKVFSGVDLETLLVGAGMAEALPG
jgi:hypothetical protein